MLRYVSSQNPTTKVGGDTKKYENDAKQIFRGVGATTSQVSLAEMNGITINNSRSNGQLDRRIPKCD